MIDPKRKRGLPKPEVIDEADPLMLLGRIDGAKLRASGHVRVELTGQNIGGWLRRDDSPALCLSDEEVCRRLARYLKGKDSATYVFQQRAAFFASSHDGTSIIVETAPHDPEYGAKYARGRT